MLYRLEIQLQTLKHYKDIVRKGKENKIEDFDMKRFDL